MAIIKKQKVEETVLVSIKMEKELISLLDEYAKYVNAKRGYVISESVRHVIERDKDFMTTHVLHTAAKRMKGRGASAAE